MWCTYTYIHRVGSTTIQGIACTRSNPWQPVSWRILFLEWEIKSTSFTFQTNVLTITLPRLPGVTTLSTPTCLSGFCLKAAGKYTLTDSTYKCTLHYWPTHLLGNSVSRPILSWYSSCPVIRGTVKKDTHKQQAVHWAILLPAEGSVVIGDAKHSCVSSIHNRIKKKNYLTICLFSIIYYS